MVPQSHFTSLTRPQYVEPSNLLGRLWIGRRGHQTLLVWTRVPSALGRASWPLCLWGEPAGRLCPQQTPALTGFDLATTGTGSGTGMARGRGTVRLNSLGSVTLALVFERGR